MNSFGYLIYLIIRCEEKGSVDITELKYLKELILQEQVQKGELRKSVAEVLESI